MERNRFQKNNRRRGILSERIILFHGDNIWYGTHRSPPKPQNNPKASSNEMFQLILSNLNKAVELLPSEVQPTSELGHATRWAAEALQAHAYLFYDRYYK